MNKCPFAIIKIGLDVSGFIFQPLNLIPLGLDVLGAMRDCGCIEGHERIGYLERNNSQLMDKRLARMCYADIGKPSHIFES